MYDSDERFPPPLCHPGTREAVVTHIKDWYGYQQGPGKPIMWVHAPAGYGKTAIAGTVSEMFKGTMGLDFIPLGATFFFWRTSIERNSPARFIITIASQLAISIPELKPHIANAVSQNPFILKKALEVQLIELIVKPFKAIGELQNIPDRLIIIDGLDECINSEQESRVERKHAEDQEKVQVRVLDLIHTLQSHHLPLSFLILSRPEAWIKQHIESRLFKDAVEIVDLYEMGDHLNDVEEYVRAELSRIAVNIGDEEWPGEDIVRHFVWRANGHILYASTVIRHIDNPYDDPRKRLEDILDSSINLNPDLAHSTPFSSLYELYRQIMRSCPESNRSLMVEVLEDVIVTYHYFGDSLGLHCALPILDSLSGRAAGSGARAIRGLHAVLRLVSNPHRLNQSQNPFIHSSFIEFLTDPMLSLDFAINKKKGSQRLLWSCLECMSAINGHSEVEEPHLRFAIHSFRSLWVTAWWNEEDVSPHQDEYVKVVKKLLTIDLTTCFIKFFDHQPPWLSFTEYSYTPGEIELKFVGSLDQLSKVSDPLSQQAIIHVLSSTERAMGRLCNQSQFNFPVILERLYLRKYLEELYNRLTNSNRWKSDEVAQALNKLRRDCRSVWTADATYPPLGWSSYIRPILDYIRQSDT
ncbi:hypothetical protein H1R20_g247, partial [Candolleomyces eurysporus]